MYAAPTEEAEVVSQAIYGTNASLVEDRGKWARIRTPDGYTGWAASAIVLRRINPYASAGRVVQVASLFANLYREPNVTKHQPMMTVPFETRLEAATEPQEGNRRWIQVRLVDGRAAWVQRGDVAVDPQALSAGETIALAKRFVGLPYLWGGTSSFGYDCSGFTQMLCRRRGVTVPRDAQPQAHWEGMIPIEPAVLKPGDLLYFGGSVGKITHSGMYIGNGEMIHATPPFIRIGRLEDIRPARGLMLARRLR